MMTATDRKLLADRLAGFNPELAVEEASTIPKSWYLDPLIYDAECQGIFGNSWLLACRTEELQTPGAFVTGEIAGERYVVIRDVEDLQLRAMSNVCRHRAARVATEQCGVTSKLRCHYHGWTYDTKGNLIGTPEFGGVCNFNKEDQTLPQWSVDTWGPFVFVRPPFSSSKQTLREFLHPLPELLDGLGLEKMKFFKRAEYRLKCNWKVFIDNYLDGCYHCNTLHPCLFGAIDYKNYKIECHTNTVVQISPLKQSEDGDVAAVRKGRDAYYSWVNPNLMLNVYEGIMDINLVLPLGPNECLVIFDFFFENTEGAEQLKLIEKSLAVAHQVQMEDAGICEEVHEGLSSRTYDTGRFSVRREQGGWRFHQILGRQLQAFAAANPEPKVELQQLCLRT